MRTVRTAIIFVLIMTVMTLGGCGVKNHFQTTRGVGDAPVGGRDSSAKDVIQMPDQFSNVANACDGHGHRVFVTTQNSSGKSMFVVADPGCGAGG